MKPRTLSAIQHISCVCLFGENIPVGVIPKSRIESLIIMLKITQDIAYIETPI